MLSVECAWRGSPAPNDLVQQQPPHGHGAGTERARSALSARTSAGPRASAIGTRPRQAGTKRTVGNTHTTQPRGLEASGRPQHPQTQARRLEADGRPQDPQHRRAGLEADDRPQDPQHRRAGSKRAPGLVARSTGAGSKWTVWPLCRERRQAPETGPPVSRPARPPVSRPAPLPVSRPTRLRERGRWRGAAPRARRCAALPAPLTDRSAAVARSRLRRAGRGRSRRVPRGMGRLHAQVVPGWPAAVRAPPGRPVARRLRASLDRDGA